MAIATMPMMILKIHLVIFHDVFTGFNGFIDNFSATGLASGLLPLIELASLWLTISCWIDWRVEVGIVWVWLATVEFVGLRLEWPWAGAIVTASKLTKTMENRIFGFKLIVLFWLYLYSRFLFPLFDISRKTWNEKGWELLIWFIYLFPGPHLSRSAHHSDERHYWHDPIFWVLW